MSEETLLVILSGYSVKVYVYTVSFYDLLGSKKYPQNVIIIGCGCGYSQMRMRISGPPLILPVSLQGRHGSRLFSRVEVVSLHEYSRYEA